MKALLVVRVQATIEDEAQQLEDSTPSLRIRRRLHREGISTPVLSPTIQEKP